MKTLFLTPRNSKKYLGGVEGHVRILTGELERRGHEVKELALDESIKVTPCFARCHLFKLQAWRYLWKNRHLFRWADVIHVHDVFWWVVPLLPVIWINKYYKSYKGYKSLNELDCHAPPKAGLAMTKTKVFVTFHGWEGVCPPTRSAVWQKKLAQRLSDGTIGVGRFFKKWYGVTPTRVVYGVLDPDCHVPLSGTRNDGLSVVFFGRLEEVNGVEILLETMDKYYKSYKDYKNQGMKYIFVGEGSYRKQAEKFGKVTGMVKNPQKYLAGADLVITGSYMSMLEAAAMGKPIIAIGNNELKEDYLDRHPLRKYIKVVKSADELYKGLTLVNQGETLKDLEVAQEWANKQTPERLADIYEELWRVK